MGLVKGEGLQTTARGLTGILEPASTRLADQLWMEVCKAKREGRVDSAPQ